MHETSPQAFNSDAADIDPVMEAMRPKTTGRSIVTFVDGVDQSSGRDIIENVAKQAGSTSIAIATFGDDNLRVARPSGREAKALLLEEFGIAIIDSQDHAASNAMENAFVAEDGVADARPEFYHHAFEVFIDTDTTTWGVTAVGAERSAFTGKGVKLAVLDTGLDFRHLGFRGRVVQEKCFLSDIMESDDKHGHGTHCCGIAAGPRKFDVAAPGYGCAPDVELFVGKVLNNNGWAEEGSVLAGMAWAIQQGCDIISVSLGRPIQVGVRADPLYERIGRIALDSGCLIIAAAGNHSRRTSGRIAPVSEPAHSSTIMAVAALDQDLSVAVFSNGHTNPAAAGVDIAAPGVQILSSYSDELPYATLSGTSMACPHVAGVAALWAESNPSLRGRNLWQKLLTSARVLPSAKRDVGAGLVQAP